MAKDLTKRQRFWLAHIRAAMKSGQRLQQYARVHRLSVGALYNAKSVFKRSGLLSVPPGAESVQGAFVPVRIAMSPDEPIRCRLQHLHGWQLEMERLPDPQWLLVLMRGEGDDATP
jgi:hypothetical protein